MLVSGWAGSRVLRAHSRDEVGQPGLPLTATPAGVARAGSETDPSSVSWPPCTVNSPSAWMRLSLTYSVWPSVLSRASTAPTPAWLETWVQPSSVSVPFGAIE